MTKYIDPLTDFAFKRIFGSEPNKDLLISFINSVLAGRKHVVDLVFNKNEFVGEASTIGSVTLDLTCTSDDGSQFHIEVQRISQQFLKKRMLYYICKIISDQAPKGRRSDWNYGISEVYQIVLMDGFAMPGGSDGRYLHDIALCNVESGEIFYNELGFYYIELVNFVKEEKALVSDLDRWLYVLKHLSKMEKLPVFLRKPIFEKLFDIAEYSQLNQQERAMYDVSQKQRWDAYAIKEEARRQKEAAQREMEAARKEGWEQGRAAGEVEGKAEGKAEGKVEGKAEGKAEVIQNLIASGRFQDEEIASFAAVSLDFVKNVRKKMEY